MVTTMIEKQEFISVDLFEYDDELKMKMVEEIKRVVYDESFDSDNRYLIKKNEFEKLKDLSVKWETTIITCNQINLKNDDINL